MFLVHTNSVYSEDITLIDNIRYPQYVHQVSDGGMLVAKGLRTMPMELVNYVLEGQYNAAPGTLEFIRSLVSRSDCKTGLILATGNSVWMGHTHSIPVSDKYPTHKVAVMGCTNVYAGQLSNTLGSFDYIMTDSTSCISGHSAWYTAQNLIALGKLDAVVVVATDNGISEEVLDIFGEYGLSKTLAEEANPTLLKFRAGQACNISVFEGSELLNRTGHAPIAKILDMHIAAESHTSPLGVSPTGEGYGKVIEMADTSVVDFIKTHCTFSKDNQVEAKLIQEIFGDIRTVNYKMRIGHTMGVSTAVETALAIQEESGTFLSLGAGMGNVFSSALVEIL